jgi:Ca-activated chloride channel homolog
MTDEKSKSSLALLAFLSLVMFLGACLDVAGQTPTQAQSQRRPRLAGYVAPPAVMANATSSREEEVGENDVVRVNTQLITVPVVVRDQQGRHVTGLTASAFQLYEDNLPQRVATFAASDTPFEIALFLDTSGSTRADIALIRGAAYAFIESLRPGDRVAVLSH